MPWIKVIPPDQATGMLKTEYDAAMKRAGRIWYIVSIMSQNPQVLKASMDFYLAILYGASPLTRIQREMLAVVVSGANRCVYWIRAHAHDLRAEVLKESKMTEAEADQFVKHISTDWRKAALSAADHALCAFAEKLTLQQHSMNETDVKTLRNFDFTDAAIHDAAQVIGYFNYITRIADALGVEPETFIQEWEC